MAPRFTQQAKERITKRIIEVLGDGTIGATERLAGIGPDDASRAKFWFSLDLNGDDVIERAMAECRRIIAEERVQWVAL